MNQYLKLLFCCLTVSHVLISQMAPKSGVKRKHDSVSCTVTHDVLKTVIPVVALQELIWNFCNGFIELKELAVSLKAAETAALKEEYIRLFGQIITERLYASVSCKTYNGVATLPDKKKIKAAWDITNPREIGFYAHIYFKIGKINFPQHCSQITYLCMSTDEKSIAVACDLLEAGIKHKKVVMIFDREKNKLLDTYENCKGPIAYSPDGNYIAMMKSDEKEDKHPQSHTIIDPASTSTYFIDIINRETHEILDTIPYTTPVSMLGIHAIDYIDFSLDSRHILMMDGRLHIRVWESELLKDVVPDMQKKAKQEV